VLNFATSSASKVYVNLNTDYVLALADRFANVCPRLHLGVSSGKGYIITILGVIEHIETQYGWFYLGCQGCCRKVNPIDGVYKCASCNVAYKNALTLFKLHLSVRDDTDVVNCVVLHKLAERMVDSSSLKLLNKSDPDKDTLPAKLLPFVGKNLYYVLEKEHKPVDSTTETALSDMKNLDDIDGNPPCNNATPTVTRKRKFIVNDDDESND
ncbi:Nucleic acid-binding, OB-fold, partial [Cynara cardunculus var. scolymus]